MTTVVSMSGLDITLGIVIAFGALTILYSFVRLWWRLRQGDVEPTSSDSDIFRRHKD